jgi:hypothetical protein
VPGNATTGRHGWRRNATTGRPPSEGPQKTSKPGSRSAKFGFESAKPDIESAEPSHVHGRPIPRKCSWSHLDPKSFEMTLLSLLFKGFLDDFQKTISRLEKAPPLPSPAPKLRSPAKRLRSPARIPRSLVRKLRSPDRFTEIAHFRRSPDQARPARFTEITRFCRSPASMPRSPVFPSPEPGPQTAKPSRHSPAPGATRERLRRCAGLRAFDAKASEIVVDSRKIDTELRSPSYFADFG